MVNYGNGKVYKIESPLGDKIYIGSTTKTLLSQRMTNHRTQYKSWKAGTRGLTTSFLLFDEYGVENCKIVLLEDCPCESKDQLSAREGHYIKTLVCVNKVIPLRTTAEYYEANREALRKNMKAYREANREKNNEKKKAYYEANREAIAEKKKAYRQANREKLNEQDRAYREANRDALAEKRKAKYQAKKAVE